MADKNGLVYLNSFHEAIRPLKDKDRLIMYDIVLDYGIYGELPDNVPSHLQGFFSLIKPVIDSSKNRYAAAKKNGELGGRPPKPDG